MKKFFYMAAVALVALVACKKEDPKTPDPDAVKLTSDAVVNVKAESEIVTIKFNANVAWKADTKDEFIKLNKKSGDAGDAEIKATVANLPEDELGRAGKVSITAGTASADVVLYQGKVFIVSDDVELGIAGGTAEFSVITNLEYTMEDKAFPWAPVTFDKATGKGSFAVEANAGYDARTAYVKFTVPAIQVPVLDEDGEPTEETEDAVYRFYVFQEGHASLAWLVDLPADFDVENTDEPLHDATVSIAKFNGKILVSDATKVYAFDPATGAASTVSVPSDLPVQSITNDDAGNLLLATLIPYGGVGSVYAVKASDTNMANPVRLIPWVNEAWAVSRGADKVAAKGDVFGNGLVTMLYGDSAFSYCLAWEIKNGAADVFDYNEWNKSSHRIYGDAWFKSPDINDTVWLSNRAVFVPAGSAVTDGFFYSGYDGLYNLYYNNGTEWTAVLEGIGNWAYAPNGMATTTWNGKKILAIVNMAYFPEWGMSSQLYIVDVTNPMQPAVMAVTEYTSAGEEHVTGAQESSTTDVILEVEGNDLMATVVDSAWGVLLKVKYPKL